MFITQIHRFAVKIVVTLNPSLLLDSLSCDRGFEDRYFVIAIINAHRLIGNIHEQIGVKHLLWHITKQVMGQWLWSVDQTGHQQFDGSHADTCQLQL